MDGILEENSFGMEFWRKTHCGWNSGGKLILGGILEETHFKWNSGGKLILDGILEENSF